MRGASGQDLTLDAPCGAKIRLEASLRKSSRKSDTTEPKFTCECFLCKSHFQFGPHVYDGRRIPRWDIMVCRRCYDGNWDGIVLESHPQLEKHLNALGIGVHLNEKGWLNWPR